MAQNDVDGDVTDSGINVSPGAQAAIGRAIESLQPHKSEPRVQALVSRLDAIRSPEGSDEREQELVKAMMSSERIVKAENVTPTLRLKAQATSRELQRSYLQKHSAGYAVWENAARESGRID